MQRRSVAICLHPIELPMTSHHLRCPYQAAGGFISAALVSVPGASAFFSGGLTIYTLESRVAFAGWDHSFIETYRGPTPTVVSTLAENVRGKLGSTYCVCESGMSGATKGSEANRQSYAFIQRPHWLIFRPADLIVSYTIGVTWH